MKVILPLLAAVCCSGLLLAQDNICPCNEATALSWMDIYQQQNQRPVAVPATVQASTSVWQTAVHEEMYAPIDYFQQVSTVSSPAPTFDLIDLEEEPEEQYTIQAISPEQQSVTFDQVPSAPSERPAILQEGEAAIDRAEPERSTRRTYVRKKRKNRWFRPKRRTQARRYKGQCFRFSRGR